MYNLKTALLPYIHTHILKYVLLLFYLKKQQPTSNIQRYRSSSSSQTVTHLIWNWSLRVFKLFACPTIRIFIALWCYVLFVVRTHNLFLGVDGFWCRAEDGAYLLHSMLLHSLFQLMALKTPKPKRRWSIL